MRVWIARRRRGGLSLLEVLAAVTVLGILALLAVPRLAGNAERAKANACQVNKGNIEVQAQLWRRQKGVWPAVDLNDLMSDRGYFPDGALTCPVDGDSYQFDPLTERVSGHAHADLLP